MSFDSHTCHIQFEEVNRFDKKIIIVDTPGFYNTEGVTHEEILSEIKQALILLTPGPHAIILVVKGDTRYGEEDCNIANLITQYFGNEMLSHLFVIFTCRDLCDKSIDQLVALIESTKQQEMKTLISNCKGRYLFFDNISSEENQVKQLFEEISKNIKLNGGNHFSNNALQCGGSRTRFCKTLMYILKVLSVPIWVLLYIFARRANIF